MLKPEDGAYTLKRAFLGSENSNDIPNRSRRKIWRRRRMRKRRKWAKSRMGLK